MELTSMSREDLSSQKIVWSFMLRGLTTGAFALLLRLSLCVTSFLEDLLFGSTADPSPVVNKYVASGLRREAVTIAAANYGDNPTKISQLNLTFKEIIYNYRKQPQCKLKSFTVFSLIGHQPMKSVGGNRL